MRVYWCMIGVNIKWLFAAFGCCYGFGWNLAYYIVWFGKTLVFARLRWLSSSWSKGYGYDWEQVTQMRQMGPKRGTEGAEGMIIETVTPIIGLFFKLTDLLRLIFCNVAYFQCFQEVDRGQRGEKYWASKTLLQLWLGLVASYWS